MSEKMKKIALCFPGQGAQYIGMLNDLALEYPEIQQVFQQASESIKMDLWDLCQNGSVDELNATYNTQPLLLASSVAIWNVLNKHIDSNKIDIILSAGHSLGEYSALVVSGSITLEEGINLVQKRGFLMDKAVPSGQGGMAAILGLDAEKIQEVCGLVSDIGSVQIANYNAPGQIVISGEINAVKSACVIAKEQGAKRALPLSVSGPFHSSLMKQASSPFESELNQVTWRTMGIPVIHNSTNLVGAVEDIPLRLLEQLYSCVNWIDAASQFKKCDLVLEVGPGKVLTGLNKRIDRSIITMPTGDIISMASAIEALNA
jgi:[acyl-carrier-protein] S-malonyltransferase